MGFLIWRLILGALCAFALLLVMERLVVWRRTEPANDDERWRKDMFGGRMAATPFVAAVGGAFIAIIFLAHLLFGVISNVGGLIFFLVGATIVAAVTRKRLPPIRQAILEAVGEIKLTDEQQIKPGRRRPPSDRHASAAPSTMAERTSGDRAAPVRPASAGGERPSRRKRRRASVPQSAIDVQVRQAIERPAGLSSTPPSPWIAPPATETNARQRDDQALVDVRRALIARLRARSTALAAVMPVATLPLPVIPVAPGPAPTPQASVEIAAADAKPEDWRTQAAAQREMWRQAGEAQRRQWREEAEALQKRLARPASGSESLPS
jgi:hypothetical protein